MPLPLRVVCCQQTDVTWLCGAACTLTHTPCRRAAYTGNGGPTLLVRLALAGASAIPCVVAWHIHTPNQDCFPAVPRLICTCVYAYPHDALLSAGAVPCCTTQQGYQGPPGAVLAPCNPCMRAACRPRHHRVMRARGCSLCCQRA